MNNILHILNKVPESPGCYLWKNKYGEIIYIGKAKNLKKRTLQYFNKSTNNRTSKLVSEISDVDYIVVKDENDSLILENNLIKEYHPKYNVLLKEGTGSYPYILVTNEKHPRILYTRHLIRKQGKYYGPFATTMQNKPYEMYLLLNKLFPMRKCNKIPQKPCMYYHLGQCLAPCINKITEASYDDIKKEIDNIFSNKVSNTINSLTRQELIASEKQNFEQALMYLNYKKQLTNISQNQIAELKQMQDADIVGYFANDNHISINIFSYVSAKLLVKHEFISEYIDNIDDIVTSYLFQYYEVNNIPKQIFVSLNKENMQLLSSHLLTKMIQPKKGLYASLLINAIQNAKHHLLHNQIKAELDYSRTLGAQEQLAKLLKLDNLNHIEIIDNSNLFASDSVSAVVVFKNAFPIKKLYRKYIIKNTEHRSDYHFMHEVILRRYSKITEFPQLLIVDGGQIQVNIAIKTLTDLKLNEIISVIGLVKNDKHQTKAIVTNDVVIDLDTHSPLYFFLSNMQNEVHRFAISFYRQRSSNSKLSQFLDNIPGIGIKSKQKLLSLYPNIYEIKNVDLQTISQIIPIKAAKALKDKIDKDIKDD